LNLSIPFLTQSEPAKAKLTKIHDSLNTNIWDIWEIEIKEDSNTLGKLFAIIEKTYKV
jgi:hypothetical protein